MCLLAGSKPTLTSSRAIVITDWPMLCSSKNRIESCAGYRYRIRTRENNRTRIVERESLLREVILGVVVRYVMVLWWA